MEIPTTEAIVTKTSKIIKETGVPTPKYREGSLFSLLDNLKIGENLLFGLSQRESAKATASLYKSRNPGWNYKGMAGTHDGIKAFRVWRTE